MKGTKIAYPALTFNDRMEIDMGDQKIEMIFIGHSHTDGSILAYLPDKKVLFAGDILFTNYHPWMLRKSFDVEYIVAEIKKSLPPRPEGDNLIPWNIQMKYLKK